MVYKNLFAKEYKSEGYEPPRTHRTAVEAESSFCDQAAESAASVKSTDNYIEVEEYSTIENDITFE